MFIFCVSLMFKSKTRYNIFNLVCKCYTHCLMSVLLWLQTGQTPLSIAQRLGYISVVEILKHITEVQVPQPGAQDEKYKVVSPETMQETLMTDSEDEGGQFISLVTDFYANCVMFVCIFNYSKRAWLMKTNFHSTNIYKCHSLLLCIFPKDGK